MGIISEVVLYHENLIYITKIQKSSFYRENKLSMPAIIRNIKNA